jgi:16S rRNA (cytosine1402-N4)-methyltransferase
MRAPTLGFGGHRQDILPKLLPGGRLYGVDVDPVELPRTEARLRTPGVLPNLMSAVPIHAPPRPSCAGQ